MTVGVGWAVAAVLAAALAALPSPAGATLAYVRNAETSRPAVWVARDDGSNPRRLASGTAPHVSPDGLQVAFAAGREASEVRVVPAAGGAAKTVVTGVRDPASVSWAPDGSHLAVVTGPEVGGQELTIVDLATGAAAAVARGYIYGASFSPDGKRVVLGLAKSSRYPVRSDLFVVPVTGGRRMRLTSEGRSLEPVWGPRTIVFVRERRPRRRNDAWKNELYTVAPGGRPPQRLTRTTVPFLLSGLQPLAWSADGTRLLAEYGGQDTSDAWTVDPATGRARDLDGRFDGVVGFGLSRDGSTVLAATGGFEPGPGHDVVAVPYGGGGTTVLARKAALPSWSR